MGINESKNDFKIIKTLDFQKPSYSRNTDNNNNINKIQTKKSLKRVHIRRNAHTVKFLSDKNNNFQKLKTKKPIMTKEQRNLLKKFLKENVKENKKNIAKNLEGIFLENNKINNEHKNEISININAQKNNNNKNYETPKISKIIKNFMPNSKFKDNENIKKSQSNRSLKKIKRLGTMLPVRQSKFSKIQKKDLNNKENKENKEKNKNDFKEKEELESDELVSASISNRILNFTSLIRLNQDINNENNESSKKQFFFSPSNNIKEIDLDDKKKIIFKRKSFREFVENNNKIDYDECLKFINSTLIISHLDESDKSLLIQSLKIKNFKKDQCILKSNEKNNEIYFVKEGLLQYIDDDGTCIKTLIPGDNFGEKEILIDINRNFNIITKSDCICYSISVKSFRKMFGNEFRKLIFYNFMKAAFDCSKLFQSMNIFFIEQIYSFFNIVNLDRDNVAFPIGHIKSSKFVIIISGNLINSKNKQIIGRPLDILFEEELLSLCEDKIKYAIDPSPDVLFFEGDTSEILNHLHCKSFEEVLNKNLIFENLSKIVLFKSFSSLKLYKFIDLIQIKKYNNGENIIKEGQKGEKFYIVKKGQVEVFQKNKYLRTLNSMEYFGERALLTNEVRSATVIAKDDVELYCLDKESFNLNLSDMMINYLNISLYLHDETISLNDLLFIKDIGKGNYGLVSLVMNKKTKFPYAIKAINQNHIIIENLQENIQLEKNILLKIDHPFIAKLVKCLKDEKNIFFLMEYIKGKELFDVIRDIGFLNKEQTNFYIASMMLAINYLHERKIIYRDIKPENIIVEENGYLKLIDFGTAKEIEDRTKTIIGTPHYMAPEIIMGGGYSFQVDYWSISICMYEFMCGEVPFGEKEEDPMEIYFAIINNNLTFPNKYVTIDKGFKHLMKKMLDKNPSYRLANFNSIKNHSWFKNFNWDELNNLNLKAPYLPNIPYSPFDFDEQCKPMFEFEKQEFPNYVDYIKNNNNYKLKENISREKLVEYKKWLDNF